jgi:hypothetical protein
MLARIAHVVLVLVAFAPAVPSHAGGPVAGGALLRTSSFDGVFTVRVGPLDPGAQVMLLQLAQAALDEETIADPWSAIARGATVACAGVADDTGSFRTALPVASAPPGAHFAAYAWARGSFGYLGRYVPQPTGAGVSGNLTAWFPITVDFNGPPASETDPGLPAAPNPFLDFRLIVFFTSPSGFTFGVPGFFDGDGAGGGMGDIWRARVALYEAGLWTYVAQFRTGQNIAVSQAALPGSATSFNGATGSFTIAPRDPSADGFYKHGLLQYVNGHYLKFFDGPYFIKTGCDSPENFLGYWGIDNTIDQGGQPAGTFLHQYAGHVPHFDPPLGDSTPLFTSADTGQTSAGIIGALNYLSSRHVNSIYFLPMNLTGDARDTHPFVANDHSDFAKTHYDISKLHQWNQVFERATSRGIQLHVVLAEVENLHYLDSGGVSLGIHRQLFFRELIARFAHNLAIKWNLAEESDYNEFEHQTFADYIHDLDPYDHPIALHTHPLQDCCSDYTKYLQVADDPNFTATSIQCNAKAAGSHVEFWRTYGPLVHPWVVEIDEVAQGVANTTASAALRRKDTLYDVLFSGGHVEWFFGGNGQPGGGDHDADDFSSRQAIWDFSWYARKFMEQNLPFWEMQPADQLVTGESLHTDGTGAEVFIKPDQVYAVYFPNATITGTINLGAGNYTKKWYNPRTGSFEGPTTIINPGPPVPCGAPPSSPGEDWVLLYKRVQGVLHP